MATITLSDQDFEKLTRNVNGTLEVIDPDLLTKGVWAGSAEDLLKALTQGDASWDAVSRAVDEAVVPLKISGEDVSRVVKEIGGIRYWCIFHRGAEQCKKALTKKNGTVLLPLIGNLWVRLPDGYTDRAGSRFFEISSGDGTWEDIWSVDDPSAIVEDDAVVTELSYISEEASPGGLVLEYHVSPPKDVSDPQKITVTVSSYPKIKSNTKLQSSITLDRIGVSRVYVSSITMPQTLLFPTISTVPPDVLPYAPASQKIEPYSYGYIYLPYEEDRAWQWVAWHRLSEVTENAKGKGILGLDVTLDYQIEVACTDRDAIISEDINGFAGADEFCISDDDVGALTTECGCFLIPSEGNNERLMITFSCAAREHYDPEGERDGVVIDNMAGVTMCIGISYKVEESESFSAPWHFPICDTVVESDGLHPTGVSGMQQYYVIRLDKDTRWWSFSYWRRRFLCKDENGGDLEEVTPESKLANDLMLAWYGNDLGNMLLSFFTGALSNPRGLHSSAMNIGTNYSGPTMPGGFGEIFFLDNLDDQFRGRRAVVTGLAVSFHDETGSAFRCGTREHRKDHQADLLVFGVTPPDGYIYEEGFRDSGMAEGGMIDVGATALLESCHNLWTKLDDSTFLADAGIRIFPVLAPGTPVVVRAKYGGTVNTTCPLRTASKYLGTYSDEVYVPKGLSAVISTPWLAGGVALRRMYRGNISNYTFNENYFTKKENGYLTSGPPSSGGQLQIFTKYEEAKWVITGLVGEGGSNVGASVSYWGGTWSATKIGTISTAVRGGYNEASGEAGTPGALGCWHLVYGRDAETLSFTTMWGGSVKYTVDSRDRDGGTVTTKTLEREDDVHTTTTEDPRAYTGSIGGDHATGKTAAFWKGPRYFATTGFETPGKMATVTVTMSGEDDLHKFEGWFWKAGPFGANDGSDLHVENYPEGCYGWVDKYGKEFTFNLPPLGITYGNGMIEETDAISLGHVMLRPGTDPDEWLEEPEDWSDVSGNGSWNDSWNEVVWGDVTDEELTMEPIGPDITDDMWMVFETPTRTRTMSLRAPAPTQDLTTKPVVVDQYGHVVWADGEKTYGSKKTTVLKVTVTCEEKDSHSGMDCLITTDSRDVVINKDGDLKERVPVVTATHSMNVAGVDIENMDWDLDGDEKTFVFRLVTKFDSNGSGATFAGWDNYSAGAKITKKASGVTADLTYSTDSLVSAEGAIATLVITIKSGAVAEGTELVSVKITPPNAIVSSAAGQSKIEAEPITLKFRVRGDVIVDPPGGGGEAVDNTVSREASIEWGQRKLNGPPVEKSLYVLVRDGTVVDSKWLVTVVAGCFLNSTYGLDYRANNHRVKVLVDNVTTGKRVEESVGLGWFKRTYSLEDIQ